MAFYWTTDVTAGQIIFRLGLASAIGLAASYLYFAKRLVKEKTNKSILVFYLIIGLLSLVIIIFFNIGSNYIAYYFAC